MLYNQSNQFEDELEEEEPIVEDDEEDNVEFLIRSMEIMDQIMSQKMI